MTPLIRVRRSAAVWFLPATGLIAGLIVPWFFIDPNLSTERLGYCVIVQLGLLLATAGYLRDTYFFVVCWLRRDRHVIFTDANHCLILFDPAVLRLDVADIVDWDVVHPGSRRREFVSLTLRGSEKPRTVPTGHYEGQAPGLIAVIERLRAERARTPAPWGARA